MSKLQRCMRRLRAFSKVAPRRYWVISSDPETIYLPPNCACCLAPANASRRETSADAKHCVIVPYCSTCLRHAARPQLAKISGAYASLLLGISCSILLSAAWDNRYGATIFATFLAALPLIWARSVQPPRQLGHAARGRAIVLRSREICCASEPYAMRTTQGTEVPCVLIAKAPNRWHAGESFGLILALVLTPCLHHLFFPVVRVVNFTDRTIQILVDDRALASVDPSSGEHPAAGETLRVPSGRHRLRALLDDGTTASDVTVEIRSGFQHLYAPGANDACFYLQRISHGRSRCVGEPIVELHSASRFWVVPNEVDQWFMPEESLRSGKTTGGVVTLLRMGQCR